MLHGVWLRLRPILLRRRVEREMQDEMAEHIERSTKRLMRRGLSRTQARREAVREFGNLTFIQEEGRIARGAAWAQALVADLKFAVRRSARRPLPTVTIVLVLAIGIGINLVLFTTVHSFAVQPVPGVERGDDLVRIRGSGLSMEGARNRVARRFSVAEFEGYSALEEVFTEVVAWSDSPLWVSADGTEYVRATGTFVTGNYFSTLGVRPPLGAALPQLGVGTETDQRAAVLSHALWVGEYARDPAVVGRTVILEEVLFTIVGVAPEGFEGTGGAAGNALRIWIPLESYPAIMDSAPSELVGFRAVARLRPGVDMRTASAAVEAVASRVAVQVVEGNFRIADAPSAEIVPLLANNEEPEFERSIQQAAFAFGVLGLLILLVTCTNVSALQTGLALARRREIAVRLSLGASRWRIVRQLITESVLLAMVAVPASLLFGLLIFRALGAISGDLPFEMVLDWPPLLFTVGIALAAGVIFGVSPALHATRLALARTLKDSAATLAPSRTRLQRGLVVAQIAFTQPLAVCVAALVLIGMAEFGRPPNEFGDRIVRMQMITGGARPESFDAIGEAAAEQERNVDRVIQRLTEIPGVTGIARDRSVLRFTGAPFVAEGISNPERSAGPPVHLHGRVASAGYLGVLGIPLLVGRDLSPEDELLNRTETEGAVPTVIGDDMARRLWGGANPVGRRVISTQDVRGRPLTLEVVGVYRQLAPRRGTARDGFQVFVPSDPRQFGLQANATLLVRTTLPAESLIPTIRETVTAELSRSSISEIGTLQSIQNAERTTMVAATALLSAGGFLALLLSALGLYALVAFAVEQRRTEIAIRMTVGARKREIVRRFTMEGVRLSALGIGLGLPLSILGLRWMLTIEPDVPEVSLPLVTAIVGLGLLGVAAVAAWVPAGRAAQVDPAITLRAD